MLKFKSCNNFGPSACGHSWYAVNIEITSARPAVVYGTNFQFRLAKIHPPTPL